MDLGALTAQAWAVAVSTLMSAKAFCIAYVVPFMCMGLVWKICYELLYAEFVLVREEEQRRVKAPRGIVSPLVLRDTEQALNGAHPTQKRDQKKERSPVRKSQADRRSRQGAPPEPGAASGGRQRREDSRGRRKSRSPDMRRHDPSENLYGAPVDRVAEWAEMSRAVPAPSPEAHGFESHGRSMGPQGYHRHSANDSSRDGPHGAWHGRPEDGHSQPEYAARTERGDSQIYVERRREASRRDKMSTESLVGSRRHYAE